MRSVISMARSLKLRAVAEGVETLEPLAFPKALECDEAQGYYFSRPVVAQQFASLLSTGIPTRHLSWRRAENSKGRHDQLN